MRALAFKKQPQKALRRMPAKRAAAILAQLQKLAADPARRDLDVKALTGRPGYRLRVGEFRAIYVVEEAALTVLWIGPRGEAYK